MVIKEGDSDKAWERQMDGIYIECWLSVPGT